MGDIVIPNGELQYCLIALLFTTILVQSHYLKYEGSYYNYLFTIKTVNIF